MTTALDPKLACCDLQLASVDWLADRTIATPGIDRVSLPRRARQASRLAAPAPSAASRPPSACGSLRQWPWRVAATLSRPGSAAAPLVQSLAIAMIDE